ncbi:MAG: hypothetical protein PHR56_00180 [Dehalococcoidales bacterium]|nr:hypothetical protein [Dehalococcoidales bacterium]
MNFDFRKKLFLVSAVVAIASLGLSVSLLYRFEQLSDRVTRQGQMLANYEQIRAQLDVRLGSGQNARLFITPDEPAVAALVDNITGGFHPDSFWKDYTEMYRWVLMNVEYTQDSPTPILPENLESGADALQWENDFWRLPIETIIDRQGDCEDISALLASMLLNYSQRQYPIWIIGARTEEPTPKAHVAVGIPLDGGHLSVFDVSGRYYTPFVNLGGFGSQPFPQALAHWFMNLERSGMYNSQIYIAFAEEYYREFSGTDEFLAWIDDYYRMVNSTPPATSPPSSSSESQQGGR